MLEAVGWRTVPGVASCDAIGVWGRRPVSRRGLMAAKALGKPVVTIEDGFLRSVRPGEGSPVVSLILDDVGVHYDCAAPSRLERLIANGAGDAARAARAIERLRALRLSKYNAGAEIEPPQGHILLIDQKPGDASIRYGGAGPESFQRMLAAALADHPAAEIIVKTHPDARRGHLADARLPDRVRLIDDDVVPWSLIDGAAAVYAVTSQMGFEAAIAGKPVRCFGAPFYAGWGATEDEIAVPRRAARRSAAQIFAAAYLDYAIYFDPWRGTLISCEAAMEALAFLRDDARADPAPSVATRMRMWKRGHIAAFLDRPNAPTRFEEDARAAAAKARASDRRLVVWAGREDDAIRREAAEAGAPLWRMEDGFLRSVGLGAALTPPLSLVLDDLGVYYDATRPSRFEALAAKAPEDEASLARARALIDAIVALNVTKYNLTDETPPPAPPPGRRVILVPGQVEDDASIRFGAGAVRTNAALLAAAREAAPGAWLIYKPHPDVEAGLRPGAVDAAAADQVLSGVSAATALAMADEVWTMTSLTGFEALLRGMPVTTFGAPFYAGWGLTDDRGEIPARRKARLSLEQLAHTALIAYPRYRDPVSGAPCPPEVIVERLAAGEAARPPTLRALAKLQGAFAGYAHLWR
ncbi:MAG: capsular polysaccharide biosynthesis protein [Pseudomonadota bacterium]